jgi:hypothetical protein
MRELSKHHDAGVTESTSHMAVIKALCHSLIGNVFSFVAVCKIIKS